MVHCDPAPARGHTVLGPSAVSEGTSSRPPGQMIALPLLASEYDCAPDRDFIKS